MEFDFTKFVDDIEKRQNENADGRKNSQHEIDLDKQRRLRSEQYHERWQNRIVWKEERNV
jgi:hypothetical protein